MYHFNNYEYRIFILKQFFEINFGNNYPVEIVYFIIGFLFRSIKIAAGLKHSIIGGDKTFVWGSNKYGQLGLGDTNGRSTPSELRFESEIKSVYCGGNFSFALTVSGKAYAWG